MGDGVRRIPVDGCHDRRGASKDIGAGSERPRTGCSKRYWRRCPALAHEVLEKVLAPLPGARARYAYEKTPKDQFRTQFLSLKPTVKVPVCVVVLATDACARDAALESVLGWGQNEVHPSVEKKVSHLDVDKYSLRERFLKPLFAAVS